MSRMESIATPAMPTSPRDPRVVGIVAAMGGQIEGDREALLTGGEVAAVEGVGLLGGGEAGVLPDGPGIGAVHGRIDAAQIGREARQPADEVELRDVVGTIRRLTAMPSGVSHGSASP